MHLSNACPYSGEKSNSVTYDYGEETLVTRDRREENGNLVTNDCRDKDCPIQKDFGDEKNDLAAKRHGEKKTSLAVNSVKEEKVSSDTNGYREVKGDSVTRTYGIGTDGMVTSNCAGKGRLGKNARGVENRDPGTNHGVEENCNSVANLCRRCGSKNCFQKCSRCKAAFYCSKACQKNDWPTHKGSCTKKLTKEGKTNDAANEKAEEEMIKARYEEVKIRRQLIYMDMVKRGDFSTLKFEGPPERILQMLTLEEALHRATRPAGSLRKAKRQAKSLFPFHDIVIDFDDIPWEPVFPFFPFMYPPRRSYVLVAFKHGYHEHVMRHSVYLKDAEDKQSMVQFYLDDFGDNPFPFFSYS